MFGGSSPSKSESFGDPAAPKRFDDKPSTSSALQCETGADGTAPAPIKTSDQAASGEKRSGHGSPPSSSGSTEQKKRRSSGVSSKASSLLASAKNTLSFAQVGSRGGGEGTSPTQTPLQKLGKHDPALAVPQGQHNNSAGESLPGPRSTFRVGVWEDRNKKCRRTMEDTHAFLYNFLHTPAPSLGSEAASRNSSKSSELAVEKQADANSATDTTETDNGYFAIFDGHAGTFAADWCGKKVHLILEDVIRKNPNLPIPELLDQTFTEADSQLEKLPLKNSGCTAAIAVLRWEDRVPSHQSATGSQSIAPATARAVEEAAKIAEKLAESDTTSDADADADAAHARLKPNASRLRVLYTANVGDARIILCRSGKALRLSYDHKGSDENEGRRIANAGGLILHNRVNGVLAVTRALGDTYIKDLVTGHPYTTETVVHPEVDEFMIIACDGLWDVCSDQEAVDLVRNKQDPVAAAKLLVDHALSRFSTDNLSCMVVRFDTEALLENQKGRELIGVEGDPVTSAGRPSEADNIISTIKQKIAEGDTENVGVSASNSGRGRDPVALAAMAAEGDDGAFVPTALEKSVEEEGDLPEITPGASAGKADEATGESGKHS